MTRRSSDGRRLAFALAAALGLMATPALGDRLAEDAAAQRDNPPAAASDQGQRATLGASSARELLDLQRSNRLASPNRQHVSGEVQARIYRRYIESFTHPIPERFIDPGFGAQ